MAKTTLCGFNSSATVHGKDLLVNHGPTLLVDIGFDPNWVPPPTGTAPPAAGISSLHALVDTGATQCCIDALLATQLTLPLINQRNIAGVHGSSQVSFYLAQIHVPSLNFTMYG